MLPRIAPLSVGDDDVDEVLPGRRLELPRDFWRVGGHDTAAGIDPREVEGIAVRIVRLDANRDRGAGRRRADALAVLPGREQPDGRRGVRQHEVDGSRSGKRVHADVDRLLHLRPAADGAQRMGSRAADAREQVLAVRVRRNAGRVVAVAAHAREHAGIDRHRWLEARRAVREKHLAMHGAGADRDHDVLRRDLGLARSEAHRFAGARSLEPVAGRAHDELAGVAGGDREASRVVGHGDGVLDLPFLARLREEHLHAGQEERGVAVAGHHPADDTTRDAPVQYRTEPARAGLVGSGGEPAPHRAAAGVDLRTKGEGARRACAPDEIRRQAKAALRRLHRHPRLRTPAPNGHRQRRTFRVVRRRQDDRVLAFGELRADERLSLHRIRPIGAAGCGRCGCRRRVVAADDHDHRQEDGTERRPPEHLLEPFHRKFPFRVRSSRADAVSSSGRRSVGRERCSGVAGLVARKAGTCEPCTLTPSVVRGRMTVPAPRRGARRFAPFDEEAFTGS